MASRITNGRASKADAPQGWQEIEGDQHEPHQCERAATVTTLARDYARELALRVREGRLPYSLERYLQQLGDDVADQVKALGVPDEVQDR